MENSNCSRRSFLLTVPYVAGVTWLMQAETSAHAQTVPWSTGTEKPKIKMPHNATDCHHHIYDPQHFPYDPNAGLKPGPALIADYRLLQKRIGMKRHVIVQPSTYGVDNSCVVDALQKFGKEARGVAVVNTSVSDAELKKLNAAGVKGLRFNMVQAGATTWDMVETLAKRIAPMGWHIQVHALGDQIVASKDVLNRVACDVVFDHLGRLPQPQGTNHPAFAIICGMMQKGKAWVKLSGAYQDSKIGPPTYADTIPLAQAYVKAAPERLVWGSDWPHPTEQGVKPNDAILADLLLQWVPDEATRKRVLVDNPAKLYRF
ncbi:MAG: amidohydrolase family protein [Candidatus Korobacteraceae bacterium]